MNAIDLFAGPGGWDLGARALGIDPVGLEWDDNACATRRAAGLKTMQCDIGAVDLDAGWTAASGGGRRDLLIASPPCQAFSMAGKGAGRAEQDVIYAVARDLFAGRDTRAEAKVSDPRSLLVVEPIRWALALQPRWICLEQVPPVLELWRAFADGFRAHGWHVWVGVLSAERYGVPQTRKRAILLADRERQPHPPEPTHQAYVPGEPAQAGEASLLGPGLLPWVSMAQALGWDSATAPSYKLARGEGFTERHGDRAASRPDEPAPTISGKARSATWVPSDAEAGDVGHDLPAAGDALDHVGHVEVGPLLGQPAHAEVVGPAVGAVRDGAEVDGAGAHGSTLGSSQRQVKDDFGPAAAGAEGGAWALRAGSQPNQAVRPMDCPAPTMAFGHDAAGVQWVPTHYDVRQSHAQARPVDEPAPCMTSQGLAKGRDVWTDAPETDATEGGYKATKGVRVTVQQAATLQTFPADYPWQGSRSAQHLQVGNAVPPLLAQHVLSALTGRVLGDACWSPPKPPPADESRLIRIDSVEYEWHLPSDEDVAA